MAEGRDGRKYRVLIIEDEEIAQKNLMSVLCNQYSELEIIGVTSSVKESVEWLQDRNNRPNIIFMDVELSDGDCFEIFRKVDIDAQVIMTTAYDNYAIKAFEAGCVDYILKPLEIEAIKRTINRCLDRISNDMARSSLNKFEELLEKNDCYRKRFLIRVGDSLTPISTSDIAYFYSEDRCNYLTTMSGSRFILDLSIDNLHEILDPSIFFQISRGCIISINAIKKVNRHLNGRLKIISNPEPPFEMTVSRSRVDDFLKWLSV